MSSKPKKMDPTPPTNFRIIENDYKHIIQDTIRDGSNGKSNETLCQRKTIWLPNDTKLFIEEYIDYETGLIDHFHYDWIMSDRVTYICKFHSEDHDKASYQTKTEPYHIHPSKVLLNKDRWNNYHYRTFENVIKFIELYVMIDQNLKLPL